MSLKYIIFLLHLLTFQVAGDLQRHFYVIIFIYAITLNCMSKQTKNKSIHNNIDKSFILKLSFLGYLEAIV